MRLLVLGGTHHVGRAFVEAALARGDEVTTVTRGVSGTPVDGAEARHADRLDPAAVSAALGDDAWDAVVDTWSAAPFAVQTSASLLRGRAAHYTYISSMLGLHVADRARVRRERTGRRRRRLLHRRQRLRRRQTGR